MGHYAKQTKLAPEKVLERAFDFFGPGGLGLEVREQGADCATFEGAGGHVFLRVCEAERGAEVDLETREWDYQVRQFMRKI